MVPDGNRIQTSYTRRYWGHLTIHIECLQCLEISLLFVCMSMLSNFDTAEEMVKYGPQIM